MFVESAVTGVTVTTLPSGADVEPITLDVDIFRPTRPQTGNMLGRARVVNASQFFVFAEVEIEDPQGRQVARGAGHLEIRRVEPPPPPPPTDLRPLVEAVYTTPDPYLRALTGGLVPDEVWAQRDGSSLMRMFADGTFLAPCTELLGISLVKVEEGRTVVTAPASEWLCSLSSSVAPGQISSLATTALWYAGLTMQKEGESVIGLKQTTRFYRALPADGRTMRAEARAVRHGPTLVLVEANVYSADGEPIAWSHATGMTVARSRRRKRPAPEAKRVLATLLFTDIVGSTEHAERLGDMRWRELLEQYRETVRSEIARCEGIEIDTAGDGFFVRFDSPGRAIECARAMRAGVKRFGVLVRVGIHTGECEFQSGKFAGMAVHIAARAQEVASPGEILVSGTVRDLAVGSGARFDERGQLALKGIPGEWRLFSVAD